MDREHNIDTATALKPARLPREWNAESGQWAVSEVPTDRSKWYWATPEMDASTPTTVRPARRR